MASRGDDIRGTGLISAGGEPVAGRGPAPKPADQRRRRNAPQGGEWVDLPREGRKGPAPKWMLPGKAPKAEVLKLWRWAWGTPQATMWEGLALEPFVARWCVLTVDVYGGDLGATALMASLPELRQIEDRLGLNPKGLQERRWRLEAEPERPAVAGGGAGTVTRLDRYRAKVEG